jgi:type I restriction enzyme S subunit
MKSIANYGARHDRMAITDDGFFSMPIPFPPLAEQNVIAEILTTADRLIAVKERLIAVKRKQKRWLMQNLLTGKLRLPRFSGAWESVWLREIASKSVEKNGGFKYSLVLTNSAQHGIIPQSEHFEREIAVEGNIDGYYIVNNGDFVYNPRISVTAPCGPIRRNHIRASGVMSPLYTVFRLSSDKVLDTFAEQYFLSHHWFRHMKSVANYGARHDRMNITDDDFFRMPIALPPLPEQQAIAAVLTAADREIELLMRVLEQQWQVKKYLMQQLLTGRIRTKGANG